MAADNFENCNKKIAAFIVTSVSLAIPAAISTSPVSASEGVLMPKSDAVQSIVRYAGPPSTWVNVDPVVIQEPVAVVQPVLRYAGPPWTWGTVEPVSVQEPVAIDVPVERYAGPPSTWVQTEVINDFPPDKPIVRYAGPQVPSADVSLKNNININEGYAQNFGAQQIGVGHYIFR